MNLAVVVLQPTANDFIHIFDFKKYWIAVPQKVPTENLGVDPNNIINRLEKDEFYSLAVDLNISPQLEATDQITPYISQIAWSPKGMVEYGRCILATLANTGQVTFYNLRNNKWINCLDLSAVLLNYLKKEWESDPSDLRSLPPSKQLSYLKKRVFQLKTTVIGWSQAFSSANTLFSCFVTGQANGDIIIWRFPALSVDQSELEPKCIKVFKSNLVRMNSITWFFFGEKRGALVLGGHSGIIKLITVQLNPLNLDEVEVLSDVDIWPDQDNIAVNMVKYLGDGTQLHDRCIIAIKGSFLVMISVDDDGALVSRNSLHLGEFNITGCEILGDSSVILSSQKGTMTEVHVNKEKNGEINFDTRELTSNIDMSDRLCYGLGASSNKMIWIMLTSIYKPFDHLILRDPTSAVLFTMGFVPDPLIAIKKNPSQCLANYWDCFETVRVLVARGSYMETEVNTENLLSQSSYELCCGLWTFQIFSRYKCQGSEFTDEMKNTIRKFEDAIFAQHAKSVLHKLIANDLKCLSDSQLLSFSLMYKWLTKFVCEYGEDVKELHLLLDMISKREDFSSLPQKEVCGFCGETHVEMKDWKNAQCDAELSKPEGDCKSSGHCLPRCSISLLQCSSLPYRICHVCSALANRDLVHMDDPVCIFCNGFLNLDDRVCL